jgi:dolichyl-phosphooligosaccharide-protein glycotransferase
LKKQETSEDISFDFSFIKKTLNNKKAIQALIPLLLLLIPLFLSVYIRSLPSELPIAEEWARQSIYNNVRSQILGQVNQQYPNLPEESKQVMVEEQFRTFLSQQGAQAEEVIKQQAEGLREQFRYGEETYLGDIDSYFWLRYARNMVEKGTYEDEMRDGVPYDTRMLAPSGMEIQENMYPYFQVALYRFLKVFDSKMTIMRAAFLTPMFISFIAIIAAFLIGRKLSGNLAGFIASIIIAVNPTVLSRSLGSDNDIVNVMFPLLIMLFVIYAFDTKSLKGAVIFGTIAGLLTGVYAIVWSGWWFIFLFVLAGGAMFIGYLVLYEFFSGKKPAHIIKDQHVINTAAFLGVFILMTFISMSALGQGDVFFRSFQNPLKVITIQTAAKGFSLWPNVYTTVAELNTADFGQVIQSLGGKMLMWLALIGTIISLTNLNNSKTMTKNLLFLAGSAVYYLIYLEVAANAGLPVLMTVGLISIPLFIGLALTVHTKSRMETVHAIILVIWFMATVYAATKGIRFILLMIPAFAISFGVFVDYAVSIASRSVSKMLDLHFWIPKVVFTLLALIVLIQPVRSGIQTAYYYVPSINDGWVTALEKIRTESSPDAIINSWWDFGHWFKYWADRKVTFDGASQDSAMAHWIGRTLLSSDEKEAVAILRMLDCGSDGAGNELTKITNDTSETVRIINSLLMMDRAEAEEELMGITSSDNVEKILSLMYCEPPENYFITSQDMVGKSGVWAHFGSWNFDRAKIYNYFKTLDYDGFIRTMQSEFEYSGQESQRLYYELNSFVSDRQVNDWIAPWPSYGGIVQCSPQGNSSLVCNLPGGNNQMLPLVINRTDMDAYVQGNIKYYPNRFAYMEDGELITEEHSENTLGYGILLMEGNRVLYASPELVDSMFTRLFYLDGQGMEGFEKFHDIVDVTGQRIITWKVRWE